MTRGRRARSLSTVATTASGTTICAALVGWALGVGWAARGAAALAPWPEQPLSPEAQAVLGRCEPIGGGSYRLPGDQNVSGDSDVWAIHVHGLGSTPDRTMQAAGVFAERGITSLFVRHAAALPEQRTTHTFGAEWREVTAWIQYARERGARRILLVGWSYGALLCLRAAAASPAGVVGLVLDSPQLDWSATIRHAGRAFAVPGLVLRAVPAALGWPPTARLAGLEQRVLLRDDFSGSIRVPVLAIHGTADRTIPVAATERFCAGDPVRTFVSFEGSRHSSERYDDPARWDGIVHDWLSGVLD